MRNESPWAWSVWLLSYVAAAAAAFIVMNLRNPAALASALDHILGLFGAGG